MDPVPVRIRTQTHQGIDVGGIHPDDQVIVFKIRECDLTGCLSFTTEVMFSQFSSGRGIDRIAQLFCTGGTGGYEELRVSALTVYQVFHDEFGHGTAADVAQTDKQDLVHKYLHRKKKPSQGLVTAYGGERGSRTPAGLHLCQFSKLVPSASWVFLHNLYYYTEYSTKNRVKKESFSGF